MLRLKLFTFALGATLASAASAQVTVLDLTKSTTPLEFNAETGAWTETYSDQATAIESQIFTIVHSGNPDWMSWNGFTASNSADNSQRENTLKFQFSNMAEGGIVLDENGEVKLTDYDAPEVSAEVPYLVGFYGAFYGETGCSLTMADGLDHQVKSVWVNMNSYPYYSVECGDAYARAFHNGDKYTLTIHGLNSKGVESSVDVVLASYSSGDLTINRGWKQVDLTSLGAVNQLYFTMSSTDTGEWGMNTPAYFCMDKLAVETKAETLLTEVGAPCQIAYDRKAAEASASGFLGVYDASGNLLMSSEAGKLNLKHLPAGVYILRAEGQSLKIVR